MKLSSNNEYSICLVSEQLSDGGAERAVALLSVFLEKNNCKVSHIIVIDKIEYQFAGKLHNLGKLKNSSNDLSNRVKRFREMRSIFARNNFDFIIDSRVKYKTIQEYLISKLIYNAPLVVSIHSYRTDWYLPKSKFLTKILYKDVQKIITVSDVISKKVEKDYDFSNVQTIHNAVDFEYIDSCCNEKINLDFEYVLAVGRLVEVKQFDQLIVAYSQSILPSKNVKLLFLGDGILREELEKLVKILNLETMIVFQGHVSNPFQYMASAKFLLLTSKNEGFPNVIIESLASNTPVISFNCLSGPSEIIVNNENGILVENQNFEALIQSINTIMLDENLYLHLKFNSRKSVLHFAIENIGIQWLQLFKKLNKQIVTN